MASMNLIIKLNVKQIHYEVEPIQSNVDVETYLHKIVCGEITSVHR